MLNHNPAFAGGTRAIRRRSLMRRVWCDGTLPRALIEALCAGDVDHVLSGCKPLQVKDRCVVGLYEDHEPPLLIKRHNWGGLWRTARMLFREPAARSCARFGNYLHDLGVPTPRPRATVDLHFGPWSWRSYLVSDYVEGTPLYQYIRYGKQSADELRHVANQVAAIWQQLVEIGASHNDFKLENFIVDNGLRVWLIDLERVRIRGDADRQLERQIFDVKNFLHMRGWHRRADARAIFADSFLQTPLRPSLTKAGVERVAAGSTLHDAEIDPDLEVMILCDGGAQLPHARHAIDSIYDIADSIALVQVTGTGDLETLKRIEVFREPQPGDARVRTLNEARESVPNAGWTLVLQQNECVTPFLAKELQQRITDSRSKPAWCIPLKRQYFGQTIEQAPKELAVRLFQPLTFPLGIAGGRVNVEAAHDKLGRLIGVIQVDECRSLSEFAERLNTQSTTAARGRFDAGQRANLISAAAQSTLQFVRSALSRRGIGSGWTGVEIAALESAFRWIEEAKLHQLGSALYRDDSEIGTGDESLSSPTVNVVTTASRTQAA
jgi:hypothetical protein